jgi:hypothetical protein
MSVIVAVDNLKWTGGQVLTIGVVAARGGVLYGGSGQFGPLLP